MSGKPKIICLIGSTNKKFKDDWLLAETIFTLSGFIVLTANVKKYEFDGTIVNWKDIEDFRDILEEVHFEKIRMADVVVLVHRDAVGESTKQEIEYCKKLNKPLLTYTEWESTLNELYNMGVKPHEKVVRNIGTMFGWKIDN